MVKYWTRTGLKESAKTALRANYWACVLAGLIFMVITGAGSAASAGSVSDQDPIHFAVYTKTIIALLSASCLFAVLVSNPLLCGTALFFTRNASEHAKLKLLIYPFSQDYINTLKVMLIMDLKIIIWSLLLIVPGIIKAYEYRMVPYLLGENPGMSANEAFTLSSEMMSENKWNAFVLDLSFILWNMLSGITFGLAGVFYVFPYICQTNANLYIRLKGSSDPDDGYIDGLILTSDIEDAAYEIIE